MHCIHADSTGREAYLAIAFKPSLPSSMSPADAILLPDAVAALAAWHHHGIDTTGVDPHIIAAVTRSVRASAKVARPAT